MRYGLKNFPKDKKIRYRGSWGVSRGCTEAWLFHKRHPELRNQPMALWCPIFDYKTWLLERCDVAKIFKEKAIIDLKSRSASHEESLKQYASRFIVFGAQEDSKVRVAHAQKFADKVGVRCRIFHDTHGFPKHNKIVIKETANFFQQPSN